MNGHFIISLDYEIHWGVFDKKTVDDYRENLINVSKVVDRLIELSDTYNIRLTFSTVGFLFAKDKDDLFRYIPKNKPTYKIENVNPYPLLEHIGNNENDDPFHYALSKIKEIKNNGNHEIGTHTFSHYYCHEDGQTVEQFNDDIIAAKQIAAPLGINLKSIVFPRNMIDANKAVDQPYLEVCQKHGIRSFRGKEKAYIYNIHTTKFYHGWYIFKLLRILDAYVSVTGPNTYNVEQINKNNLVNNLPSSRLFRAYSSKLKFLEPLKIRRIKKAMTYAAKHNEMFHLWWHPHNFGTQTSDNLKNLEEIFKTYKKLNKMYGFKSETMTGLSNKIDSAGL
ncbi:polysaccharide deacetylase family protein [Psychroserpens burtonensis]|uniref:Polysaccharide deacetylase family protein n=1 Tax=Psychroserpens burtonensis TaxID=49278 RepID=A0A5C7BFV5_9FLAO|nr:polysaccharide deacetylase family protein [Psychroserpens burtonensis]TXE20236.1 polysaccharide deacetylase family protein [Psychroserpens burtonensis]